MFISILILIQSVLHPFHVSVSEVKYKEDIKALQISTRIFLDDLEVAMQTYIGDETLDIMKAENWTIVNEHLHTYLLENIKCYDAKGMLDLKYVGAEIEDDVMWAYLEIEKVKKLKTITIWNSVLTESFDDQENLIHFRAFDKVKSARLFKGTEQEVFNWE